MSQVEDSLQDELVFAEEATCESLEDEMVFKRFNDFSKIIQLFANHFPVFPPSPKSWKKAIHGLPKGRPAAAIVMVTMAIRVENRADHDLPVLKTEVIIQFSI